VTPRLRLGLAAVVMWRPWSAPLQGAASVVVPQGCGFSARFAFSVHDVANLMPQRAENGAAPADLTVRTA